MSNVMPQIFFAVRTTVKDDVKNACGDYYTESHVKKEGVGGKTAQCETSDADEQCQEKED